MPHTRWLDDDEQAMWRAFYDMRRHLDRALELQLAEHGLSHADYAVLVVLTDVPERQLRARELGERISWESSRLAHHLRRLEHRGLVSRCGDPADRRGTLVSITDAGTAAIRAAAPGHVTTVRRCMVDLLTADEVAMLTSVSRRVSEAATASAAGRATG